MTPAKTDHRLRKPEYWLSLTAIALIAVCYYGIRAAAVFGLAAVTAVLTDFICLFLQNKSYKAMDLSNAAAAVIMAMMFPASIPYSIVLISTVFAIAVGVHVFGSRGHYLFHPAAVGYLFALLCWKHEVLQFPASGQMLQLFGNGDISLQPSVSAAFAADGRLHADKLDLFIGAVRSPMGTGCIFLLIVVLVIQSIRKSISLYGIIGYLSAFSIFCVIDGQNVFPLCIFHMILFGGIFLVSDTAMIPEEPLCAMAASFTAGALTYYLAAYMGLEYAPAAAMILICPLWQILREHGEKVLAQEREEDEAEKSGNNAVPASAPETAATEANA